MVAANRTAFRQGYLQGVTVASWFPLAVQFETGTVLDRVAEHVFGKLEDFTEGPALLYVTHTEPGFSAADAQVWTLPYGHAVRSGAIAHPRDIAKLKPWGSRTGNRVRLLCPLCRNRRTLGFLWGDDHLVCVTAFRGDRPNHVLTSAAEVPTMADLDRMEASPTQTFVYDDRDGTRRAEEHIAGLPRDGTRYVMMSSDSAKSVLRTAARGRRFRFRCHGRNCTLNQPVRRESLEVLFRRAIECGQSCVSL